MTATGLKFYTNSSPGTLERPVTATTGGLGFLVEHTTGGPRLVLHGGVRNNASDGAGAGIIAAVHDYETSLDGSPTFGLETIKYSTLARSEMGLVSLPGTTSYTVSESASWERNVLTYTGGSNFTLTVSRLTPALRFATTGSSARFFGGTVAARTVSGGVVSGTTRSGTCKPRWIAYHTAGGTLTQLLTSGAAETLAGIDQPWLLVWWGNRSHWCETARPMTYSHTRLYDDTNGSAPVWPGSDAYQADAPMLLVFGNTPTSVTYSSTTGGIDVAWSGAAGSTAILPLYGRERLHATTGTGNTEGWGLDGSGANFPASTQTLIDAWLPRLKEYPETCTEAVVSRTTGPLTVTGSWTFTYTTIAAGGTQVAPLPPVFGIVRHAGWADLTFTTSGGSAATITDTSCPTEFGPYQVLSGASVVRWTLTNLDAYTTARAAPGGGTRTAAVQSALDTGISALTGAGNVLAPWITPDRPQPIFGGDVYGTNPADSIALLAECVPLASSSQATALTTYLASYVTKYPLTTQYDVWLASQSNGDVQRGAFAIPTTHFRPHLTYPWLVSGVANTRVPIWNAYALMRYHQVTGASLAAGSYTALAAVWGNSGAEKDELDWATGHPFAGKGDRDTAVEDCSRRCAGLIGLYWLAGQQSTSGNQDAALLAFARQAVLRVAMAHYPRWLASAGTTAGALLSFSGLATNWHRSTFGGRWDGNLLVDTWADANDDPRQVVRLSQFGVHLDDSNHDRSLDSYALGHAVAYRGLTPPVAALLVDALGTSEPAIFATKHVAVEPHWHVPFAFTTLGGEHGVHQPANPHGTFLARALIQGVDAATLVDEVGFSWLSSGGDEFTLNKQAEALRAEAGSGPTISVTASPSSVQKWAKAEWTLTVATVATNTFARYDTSPPSGVTAGIGVTVLLELSTDSGATWPYTRRCFSADEMSYQNRSGVDWWHPTGSTRFVARFAPPTTGTWTYRFRATDASGESVTSSSTFTVTSAAASAHGFVGLAPDARYFQWEDGTRFTGFGVNIRTSYGPSAESPKLGSATWLAELVSNGVEQGRVWLSGFGPFGSYAMPFRPEYGGDDNEVGQVITGTPDFSETPDTGRELLGASLWVTSTPAAAPDHTVFGADTSGSRYLFSGQGGSWPEVYCKASTTYRVQMRVNVPLSLVQDVGGEDWGVVAKYGPWLFDTPNPPTTNYPWRAPSVGGGSYFTGMSPSHATGWQTLTGTYTTGASEYTFPNVYLVLQNCKAPSGAVRSCKISELHIYELDGSSNVVSDISPMPHCDVHTYVKEPAAYRFDLFLEACEAAGITMVVNVSDKNDNVLGHFDATTGAIETPTSDNMYGPNSATISRSRWWQREWWDYCAARWGYSTAIHSWELLNEGDPHHGGHFNLAELFAQTIKARANSHLCTASTWFDVPLYEFWCNASFPSLDYITWHAYCAEDAPNPQRLDTTATPNTVNVNTPADWADTVMWQTRPADLGGTTGTYGPAAMGDAKPVVRHETDLTETETGPASTEMAAATAAVRKAYHKFYWAQAAHSAGMKSLVWYVENLATHIDVIAQPKAFEAAFRVDNGGFVDISPTLSHANLRAYGQKNTTAGTPSAFAWVDNTTDTWRGTATTVNAGQTVSWAMPSGSYTVTVSNTTTGATISSGTVTSSGTLTVTLPAVASDVAVTAVRQAGGGGGGSGRTEATGRTHATGRIAAAGRIDATGRSSA